MMQNFLHPKIPPAWSEVMALWRLREGAIALHLDMVGVKIIQNSHVVAP